MALTVAPDRLPPANFSEVGSFTPTFVTHGLPIITISVDDHTERMVLDSGAANSFITFRAARALGIKRVFKAPALTITGVGGVETGAFLTVGDLGIGAAEFKGWPLLLGGLSFGNSKLPLNDGILGNDVLSRLDVALDLPDNRVAFFISTDCEDDGLTPWPGNFAVETLTRIAGDDGAAIPYGIDGKPFVALIDSGFSVTQVFQAALARAGIAAVTTATEPVILGYGFGPRPMLSRRERFASLDIGAEDYGEPWINVADNPLGRNLDVVVGEDYLRYHRAFISNSTAKVYLSTEITHPTIVLDAQLN